MTESRRYIRMEKEHIVRCEPFSARNLSAGATGDAAGGVTRNVSAGGMLFRSDRAFEIGALVKLEMDIPGWERFKAEFYKEEQTSESSPMVVLGRVVRIEEVESGRWYDIGVTFAGIDDGHQWALKKYVDEQVKE